MANTTINKIKLTYPISFSTPGFNPVIRLACGEGEGKDTIMGGLKRLVFIDTNLSVYSETDETYTSTLKAFLELTDEDGETKKYTALTQMKGTNIVSEFDIDVKQEMTKKRGKYTARIGLYRFTSDGSVVVPPVDDWAKTYSEPFTVVVY